jgi:predicted ArsR family transcriptional regulator
MQKSKNAGESVRMNPTFEEQSETKKAILMLLKQNGSETITNLGTKLNISNEGVRLHLVQLERDGLVKRHNERTSFKGGRPAIIFTLTSKGEMLFPKKYDALTIEVIDTVANQLGKDAVKKIFSTMVDARVSEWEWRLNGLSLAEKATALKDLYISNDIYMDVDFKPDTGNIQLTERNCPFYDIAMQRPALCSVTLNTLTRLLGYRVVREKSFQNGDGCCVFRVQTDKPIDSTAFLFEEEDV